MTQMDLISLLRQIRSESLDNRDFMIHQMVGGSRPVSVGFLNQHGVNLALRDPGVLSDFRSLDYIFRDGIGVKLACQALRVYPGDNFNGTDLIPDLVKYALRLNPSAGIFIFGTQEPWLSRGGKALADKHTFFTLDGFRSAIEYIEFLKNNKCPNGAIVVLGMGMPKQESIARLIKEEMKGAIIVVCGGAIIDFKSGRFPRAPLIFRKCNLEWLYRLCREPRRLFARYVIGIPVFSYHVFSAWIAARRHVGEL